MFKNIIKTLLGILSIPLALGVCAAFFSALSNIQGVDTPAQKIFLLGVVLYVIAHLFLFKPNYLYVFGHEFVHVIAIWLSFGSVKQFKVSKNGGSVSGTKNNLFISISPYFVPIFPIILSLIYFVLTNSYDIGDLETVFMGLLGFTVAMHLIMTIDILKIKQPDLIVLGQIFATVLVVSVNIIIIGFIVSVQFKGFYFRDFLVDSYIRAKDIYLLVIKQLFFLVE